MSLLLLSLFCQFRADDNFFLISSLFIHFFSISAFVSHSASLHRLFDGVSEVCMCACVPSRFYRSQATKIYTNRERNMRERQRKRAIYTNIARIHRAVCIYMCDSTLKIFFVQQNMCDMLAYTHIPPVPSVIPPMRLFLRNKSAHIKACFHAHTLLRFLEVGTYHSDAVSVHIFFFVHLLFSLIFT